MFIWFHIYSTHHGDLVQQIFQLLYNVCVICHLEFKMVLFLVSHFCGFVIIFEFFFSCLLWFVVRLVSKEFPGQTTCVKVKVCTVLWYFALQNNLWVCSVPSIARGYGNRPECSFLACCAVLVLKLTGYSECLCSHGISWYVCNRWREKWSQCFCIIVCWSLCVYGGFLFGLMQNIILSLHLSFLL